MQDDNRDIALHTYRSLRSSMVVMVVMLATALVLERLTATDSQTSISAYYYTTAHSIFIAALCVLGALLIIYEGSTDTEDVLLNLAGVLAFVVAMVPTNRPETLYGSSGLPMDYDVAGKITNNVGAVVIALGGAQLLYWTLARWTQGDNSAGSHKISLGGKIFLVIFWAVILFGLICFFRFRERFNSMAHYGAAVTMFVAIIINVGITAFLVNREERSKSPHRKVYQILYTVVAVSMGGTLIAIWALHHAYDAWKNWIIWVESLLILEFGAYWAIQTIELWKTPDRKEKLTARNRSLLGKGKRGFPETIAPQPPATKAERVLHAL